jgi:predicted nuclease of restriction endonuclease-like (RecB) superfamily
MNDYKEFLNSVKSRIQQARAKSINSINQELILLYWHLGKDILSQQKQEGWGARIIENLSKDLAATFPDMKGFSPRNLLLMRSFALAYSEEEKVKQLVSLLPWGHIIRLLQTIDDPTVREWYIRECINQGWSRNVLLLQIQSRLFERQGKATTNFSQTMLPPQSDLAQESLKDPYLFDFLSLDKEAHEREIEKELTAHITKFLLELGAGFSFVGRQQRLEVDGEEYFIDLLFYHLKLRCYIVVELKTGDCKPEYAGKLNFYLSAVDASFKHETDNPSIGLMLCRSKKKLTVEYALKDMTKPIGVSEYILMNAIPEDLKTSLPSIEEIEDELGEDAHAE